ncbi:MAG: hypothetical protein ACRC3I_09405 [Cetobacterium sp.]
MLNWNVKPLKEVNGIKFGMKREKVRELLSIEAKEFKKSKFSKNTTDDFGFCHVFYNLEDKCEAVEIFKGIETEIEVLIEGKIIFPVSLDVVKSYFKDLEKEDDSYISKTNSMGIYAPNEKMESILFGELGYYD